LRSPRIGGADGQAASLESQHLRSPGKFEQEDREPARNFADVARDSGLRRIVYLGGLGSEGQALSAHLRSRHEVADILRSSQIPTIEFRASIVIGSGSLSFEMIRALVQRLPVMNIARIASVPCSLTYSCCQHNIVRPMIQTIRQFIKS